MGFCQVVFEVCGHASSVFRRLALLLTFRGVGAARRFKSTPVSQTLYSHFANIINTSFHYSCPDLDLDRSTANTVNEQPRVRHQPRREGKLATPALPYAIPTRRLRRLHERQWLRRGLRLLGRRRQQTIALDPPILQLRLVLLCFNNARLAHGNTSTEGSRGGSASSSPAAVQDEQWSFPARTFAKQRA